VTDPRTDPPSGPPADPPARTVRHLRDRWSADVPAFGLWSTLADPVVAELLAASPFDYVCVDLQHGLATWGDLPAMATAMRAAGRAPVVRVPWNEPAPIMRALDVGAVAVIVPMVNSADDARRAVSACRYPPAGTRSWGPMWAASRPVPEPAGQDAQALCLVMIETAAAVADLDAILRVPGLDGVYIGPNDLALSCGHGRATYRDDEAVERLLDHVVTTVRSAGLVAGLHCSDPAMAAEWAGRGARLLTTAHDATLLAEAVERTWTALGPPDRA